jgi:hypothetical protein
VSVELSVDEPLLAEPLSAVEEFDESDVDVEVDDWFWTLWSPSPDSAFDELSARLDEASASCAKADPENARIADAAMVVSKVFFTVLISQSFLLQQRPA